MNNRAIKLTLLFVSIFILLACELPVLSTPAPSNQEPVPINTIIAGTVAAAQTQTAVMLPIQTTTPTSTSTPLPTKTPTITLTPTETFVFVIPTSTKPFEPHSAGSQCDLIALTPFKPIFNPGDKFDTSWTLQNTGSDIWFSNDVDFKYSSGTDMHPNDIYDLPHDVTPGGNVIITVSMVAPQKTGTFTTNWVLSTNNKTLCKVSTTVTVR